MRTTKRIGGKRERESLEDIDLHFLIKTLA
jgi:hypothetical protein